MHVQLDKLRGRAVVDANGSILGRVREPLVDMETWLIDALRVRPKRAICDELGLHWSFFRRPTIDIPTGQVQAAGDAILLRVAIGDLREMAQSAVHLQDPLMPTSIH